MAQNGNNFDFLRLVAASAVAVYHLIVLPQAAPPELLERIGAYGAATAVEAFFVISGFLIYGSVVRTRTISRYASKRARRLYPAYATVVIAATLAAVALNVRDFEAAIHAARYFAANIVFLNFLEPTLPGLFANNPHTVVNGSLWTIKIEVMFYLIAPLLAWALRAFPAMALCAAIYAASVAWRLGFEHLADARDMPVLAQLARQLPGQMAFFISGAALWLLKDRVLAQGGVLAAAAVAALALSLAHPWLFVLKPAALAMLIFLAAYKTPVVYDAGKHGDFSYGVYILHFPIIQALVAAGVFAASYAGGAALAICLTALSAFGLWRFVERRFLLPSSHYVGGEGSDRADGPR